MSVHGQGTALENVSRRIAALKAELHDQAHLSNAAVFAKLDELGGLLEQKNGSTGLAEDLRYFYVDNGEYLCHVAGFLGDETPLVDASGQRLLVGDTVTAPGGWTRMVILHEDGIPMLGQEDLLARGAVRSRSFEAPDMTAAHCAAFTVTCESCLERLRHRRQVENELNMKFG